MSGMCTVVDIGFGRVECGYLVFCYNNVLLHRNVFSLQFVDLIACKVRGWSLRYAFHAISHVLHIYALLIPESVPIYTT